MKTSQVIKMLEQSIKERGDLETKAYPLCLDEDEGVEFEEIGLWYHVNQDPVILCLGD